MNSCNRAIVSVLVLLSSCEADTPDVATAVMQNIGLPTSNTPPLGEAVAPISGFPGDGAAVAIAATSWSTPGAVRWHGGQWLIPYSAAPGSVLQNVSCDIWNPTTSAPANVLVEVVSSNGQVLGSATAPASTSVTFRLWPFLGTHPVIDGEQVIMRLSPTDATTGAWTTAAQDTTVIGCAVNTSKPVTRSWAIVPGAIDVQSGSATCAAGNNTSLSTNGSFWIPIPNVAQDETIVSLSLYFQGNSIPNVSGISLWATDPQGNGNATQVTGVSFATSTGTGTKGGAWLQAAMTGMPSIVLRPTGVAQFFLFVQTNSGGTTSITTGSYTVTQ